VKITKVKVRLIDMKMVKGLASVVFDDCFVVHELRIVDGDRGYFVAMPSRKLPNGEFRDIAHPLRQSTRDEIQDEVLKEFFRVKQEKEQQEK
jgi:stage V sporulation protein G